MKIRIVYNKLLGGWFIVRGPHQTPIGGVFATKAAAKAHLEAQAAAREPDKTYGNVGWRNFVTGVEAPKK